jgi:hypothetical protein
MISPNRDLYLATHTTEISMPPAEFENITPASERPQTHAFKGSEESFC